MAKILIVEDDEEIAMLERDYLEIEGFQTEIISDGGAAEEAALTGGLRSDPAGPDAAGAQRL